MTAKSAKLADGMKGEPNMKRMKHLMTVVFILVEKWR
jgi:hypothetical protein